MSLKVSVVVPVYNPGAHIDDGIDSLLRQSLPPDQYEAIFVDDGSTDGTGERLDRLAAEHANVTAIHIPNSGWPGRPRNIGLDAARGEYVLFMDNDDRLGDEALERLYERAAADHADVVVGKVVGHGRSISRDLFAANRRDVDITWPPLLELLTPHKLFRRAFLLEHGLRFPEGRVRLEDHSFVVPAFFAARSISVLADYPVYHWIKREDDTNASAGRFDEGYWQSLRDVLDVVEARVEPGPLRERLLSHWLRTKLLARLGGASFARQPADYQEQLLKEIGAVMRERMPPQVTDRLRSALRIRARLVQAGRLDGLRALAEVERDIGAGVTLRGLDWDESGALRLRLEGLLTGADGRPLAFERDGDRVLRRLPAGLPGGEQIRDEDRDVSAELERGTVHVALRSRDTRAEYTLDVEREVRLREDDQGGVIVAYEAVSRLDPATAAAGAALDEGIWDLSVVVISAGLSATARLPLGDVPLPPPALTGETPSRVAIAYETVEGNLSLDLGEHKRSLPKLARGGEDGARASRGPRTVAVSLPMRAVAAPHAGGREARLVLAEGTAGPGARPRVVSVPARLVPDGRAVTLQARVPFRRRGTRDGTVTPGAWLLAAATAGEPHKLGLSLGLAADGSPRVRALRKGRPRRDAVPPTALRRTLHRVPLARRAVALARRALRRR